MVAGVVDLGQGHEDPGGDHGEEDLDPDPVSMGPDSDDAGGVPVTILPVMVGAVFLLYYPLLLWES